MAHSLDQIDLIPAIDNHCHPIVRDQQLTVETWQNYWSPAHDAGANVPYTVYYRWGLRQLAAYLGVEPNEEAVVRERNSRPFDEYVRALGKDANIAGLVEDEG